MNDNYSTENFISDKLVRLQLSNLRKSSGLTQKEIREKTGLSLTCISNIENGDDTAPTLKSIVKYLDAIGYEMSFTKKKEIL